MNEANMIKVGSHNLLREKIIGFSKVMESSNMSHSTTYFFDIYLTGNTVRVSRYEDKFGVDSIYSQFIKDMDTNNPIDTIEQERDKLKIEIIGLKSRLEVCVAENHRLHGIDSVKEGDDCCVCGKAFGSDMDSFEYWDGEYTCDSCCEDRKYIG